MRSCDDYLREFRTHQKVYRIKLLCYPAVTAVAAGRYDRNDCMKSGLYQTMIMEENTMKNLNMKSAIKRYNGIMWGMGYDHLTIGTSLSEGTENWNIRDMFC